MSDSLKSQAVKGLVWSAVERFSVQGIQFVLSIIIARLVAPTEYGLIAMLGIFLAIAQTFVDSGFSNALIQKKDRTEIDFSTVFYFNIVVSFVVYLILFLFAPYIALFYREPLLNIITKWVGLNIIISAFSIVQRAKLTIRLNFKIQAKISLISVIISGISGVVLAYYGYGVWALVCQSLLNNLLNTLLLWGIVHWCPLCLFSVSSFRILFSFGSKLLIGAILHTIYLNLYSLVIGRWYSAINVGYYNRAYSLANFPSVNMVSIVSRVTYPFFCEIQNNKERLSVSFLKCIGISCYFIFPLMIGIAVLSKPLIQLLLTDKWLPAADLLFILCLAYMWYPVMYMYWQILNVKGRTDLSLKAEVVKKILSITILLLSIPWGINAMCYGILLYNICDIIIISFYVRKVIGISLWKEIMVLYPLFTISLLMGGCIHIVILAVSSPYMKILFGILVGIGIYLYLSCLFHLPEYYYIKSQIKMMNKSNLNNKI